MPRRSPVRLSLRRVLLAVPSFEAGIVAVMLLVASLQWPGAASAAVPANFTDSLVASLPYLTDIEFSPVGDLYATTQGGKLYKITGGPTVVLDLSAKVNTYFERGLLGVAFDPGFASNHFVYLYYTMPKSNATYPGWASTPAVNRVSRFTIGSGVGSELVLIDNIPSPNGNHNAGDLHIGADGYLYVATGDGGCDIANCSHSGGQNTNARRPNILNGKILRITTAGGIPASNPFASTGGDCRVTGETTPGTHCRETFAWGLRNPFRMAFNVANTGFFINDVGQDWIEEIDASSAGADYGWSCMEGNAVNLGCAGSFTAPIYTYTHANGCTSITGGAFVPAGVWPSNYDNGYLFADYVCGKIFFRNTSGAVTQFASGLGGLTTLKFGPNGSQSLYYTNYDNGGQIRKITFSGPANQPPTAKIGPNKRYGALPLTVTFRSTGSSDPNGDPLTFRWDFGDGSPEATGATVQHTYTSAEDFIAVLTASDGRGGQTTASAKIFAGDTPPQPTIAAPLPADLFSAGQQITLTGSASDVEQGTIADERLTWEVLLHHDTHTHPFMPPTSGNNLSLTAPEPEDLLAATNSYLEIKLTATDARGLKTTVVQNLMPKKVDLTFTTNNPGTPLMLEGTLYRSPATVTTWAGNPVDVDIADSISPSGQPAQWSSWSDGGDRAHTIVAPATNETYTATFVVESAPAYIATADAHVRLAQSSTNFGRERRFSVTRGSAAENGFLRFSLTGVPAGFQSATLYLFVTDSSNNGPTVYRTSSAWKETTVTWANQPNRSGAALGSFGRVLSNTWVALDVTAAVAGDGTVNFVLLGDSSDRATFAARTTAGKEPRLVLRGATGDGTPPSTPANLAGDAMASNTVNLSWDASTDASGIANYDVLREGVLLGATTSTSFVDKTAPANSSLDYIVIARDGSGLTSAPSATATVDTPMPTSTFTFAPGDDTFVFASSPSTNYGTRSYLQTRGTSVITFIRFTTQGLQGPVYRATLRVYVTDGTDDGPAVFKTTNSGWAETTLTYANKPGPTSSVPADDTGAIASGGWIELDVTALIAGNGPIAFLLQQTSGDAASFGSSESATPPQLIVTAFQTGGASIVEADIAPSPSPSPSPAATATPVETATEPTASPAPLSLPFTDGFESGDLAAWEANPGLVASQAMPRSGAWSAAAGGNATGVNASAILSLGENQSELYVRTAFRVEAKDAQSLTLVSLRDGDGNAIVHAGLSRRGRLMLVLDRTGEAQTSFPVSLNEWHALQLHLAFNGGAARADVWLDGALVGTASFAAPGGSIAGIGLGEPRGDRSFQLFFDDVVVDRVCIGDCSQELVTPEPEVSPTVPATVQPESPVATTEPATPEPEWTPTEEATVEQSPTVEPTPTPEPTQTPEPPAALPAETPVPPGGDGGGADG